MNLITSTKKFALLSCLIAHSFASSEEPVVVYQGKKVHAIVPDYPLDSQAIAIECQRDASYADWDEEVHQESFGMIRQIVDVWEKSGYAEDYLIYGKETGQSFHWQIVPYPKKEYSFWKQLNVLWKVTFGSSPQSEIAQKKAAQNFYNLKTNPNTVRKVVALAARDPFCQPHVIEKQRIFEGRTIDVLYNYAPYVMGKEKLHFLVIPKTHRTNFTDLTEEEYLETAELTRRLLNHFEKKGFETAYIFHRTGKRAGQSVPHFHQHVIFTATKADEFLGKLKVFKNMLFGNPPMKDHELKAKVEMLRSDFRNAF